MSEPTENDNKSVIENNIDENKQTNQQSKKKKERRHKNKDSHNDSTAVEHSSNKNQANATKKNVTGKNESEPSASGSGGAEKLAKSLLETPEEIQSRLLLEQLKLNPNLLPMLRGASKSNEETIQKTFKFWSTQPVPKFDEKIEQNEAIEADKQLNELRQDPYALPDGFKWETLDLYSESVLRELYTLLNENYVEDDDAMFRFDYQPEFLRWALQPPGWLKEWHVGVRVVKSGLLVGFISAIPGHVRIHDKVQKIVEINFLCVHKKLRSKRVAPVLIREITRRVNLTGIFQAVYTAGVVLPKPISTCRYWHRSLNPKKLIDVSNILVNTRKQSVLHPVV